MLKRILTLARHWREAKSALSTLSYLYSVDSHALDALGGLTQEEMDALIGWLPAEGRFVEVGTLFGLTVKAIRQARPSLRIAAVDNFSWNPFGLPASVHEAFTRRILAGSDIGLINCSSESWRAQSERIDAIFFDASHRYEDVKDECLWAKERGIPLVMGHDYNNDNPLFGVTRAVNEVFGAENVEVAGMCWKVIGARA